MISLWTKEDIEEILRQLDAQELPFSKVSFSGLGQGLVRLGSGGFSEVYEAEGRKKQKNKYAIKVLGFAKRRVDWQDFDRIVETQKSLGGEHVVKILEAATVNVWIRGRCEVIRVEKVRPEDAAYTDIIPDENVLQLRFILMEKLAPVLSAQKHRLTLFPQGLAECEEGEILKCACDIGNAIREAHEKGWLHRDIKPENIFYDAETKNYKLGDFGIAGIIEDEVGGNVLFTEGYAAPEIIGVMDDRYDQTTDIYSFGITLYVLLNELRFPGALKYKSVACQYMRGYEAPEPVNGSDELVQVVLRMIRFDPDERYQSMEDVLNELEKLRYGKRIKYQREHRSSALALGAAFALVGAVIWKGAFAADTVWEFTRWMWIFWGLCIFRTIRKLLGHNGILSSFGIFGIGIYLAIQTGFSIWKLLVILNFVFVGENLAGILGGCAIAVHIVTGWIGDGTVTAAAFVPYRWVAVLLLSLALYLLYMHFILEQRGEQIIKTYLHKNAAWLFITAFYGLLILTDYSMHISHGGAFPFYEMLFGADGFAWVMSCRPATVGICGVIFCIAWMLRERVLILVEKLSHKSKWANRIRGKVSTG
ncbi:MAG: serine/threonine protein kinase [Lachnospiraceae bacterium]|nr:serine/threonine protein kinase [Lachnospiraceae bacterium]